MGSSLDDLRSFPDDAKQDMGFQLEQVQFGLTPDDWKPLREVGRGAREIRVRMPSGAYRTVYVTQFDDAVYVLHCFVKKSQKTSKKDIAIAARRYRDAKQLSEMRSD